MNTIGQKYYKVWQVFSSEVEEQVSRHMNLAYEDCLFRLQKSKNYEDAVKHWNVQRKILIDQIRKTDKKWLEYEYAQSLRLFF